MLKSITDNLFYFDDTCRVYVIRRDEEAVLIDFGAGDVLDHLSKIGVTSVAAILMTHHHRDQGQGLPRAVQQDIPIYVPHTEQDLFHSIDEHWQARAVMNSYDNREDRFSLLQSVPVAGTLRDYQTVTFSGQKFDIIPTPGHTQGSISLQTNVDARTVVFSGDLIAGHGKLWSLAATQWSYNGAEGVAASVPSLLEIKRRQPDLLLPSHGHIIDDAPAAIDALVDNLAQLLQARQQNPRLFKFMQTPYREVTPNLLFNQTSMSNSYVVKSRSGKALIIDYGYDFVTGVAAGSDRASRRPSLYTIRHLKEQYGIRKIDVILPTHFHDDHVAGINLLRDVEGTECWAAENFSDILQHPTDYDLPCLWYDPIGVDRVLPLEQPIQWEEYTFTLHHIGGHTHYAVAIAFEIDGKRVLASGDQYQGDGDQYNYVYKNDYKIGDYIRSAELFRRLQPDIIITGHWEPLFVQPSYYDTVDELGATLDKLDHALLPLDEVNFDARGFAAFIHPYQAFVMRGTSTEITVTVRNPFDIEQPAQVTLTVPAGWQAEPQQQSMTISPYSTADVTFRLTPSPERVRRARIAADVTIGSRRFGQHAEALITVKA